MTPCSGRDAPFTPDQHARYLDHMAALHAAFWGWRDDVGLTPLDRRYLLFSPGVAAAEGRGRQHGGGAAVHGRRVAAAARRLARHGPVRAAPAGRPGPLVAALARLPHTLVHGDWKAANLGSHPDGRTVLLDFGEAPGEASPLADLSWYLALNAALLPESKDDVLGSYRVALAGHGVDATDWWEDAAALELLGCMLQFGWEKALGGPGDELLWWEDRVPARRRAASSVRRSDGGPAEPQRRGPAQGRLEGARRGDQLRRRPEQGRLVGRAGGPAGVVAPYGMTPGRAGRRPSLRRRGRTVPPGR